MAATGEEDYDGTTNRRGIAHQLVQDGIASVLLVVPFYGCRRPAVQAGERVASVHYYT